jgi:IS4 transposase
MEHRHLELDDWSRIEERLGGAAGLTASAQQHGALRRRRGVRDGASLLRLALMYGPGGQSLRSLSALAAVEGLAELSDVALLNRLKQAADWLEALCRAELAKVAAALATPASGRAIRLIDASRIEAPGGGAWRLHLCVAPQEGRMVEAAITPIGKGERLDRLSFQPGEIRIGDRGYPQPDGLRAAREAGADVLVRLTWNSVHLLDSKGRPLDWTRLFKAARRHGTLDHPVVVSKPRGTFAPLPLRLVMIRKPPQAAAKARLKARRASQKQQRRRTDPRTLAAADFLILLTSLDAKAFPLPQLGALYRLRWQVELTFKRLKSLLHIDQLRARNADLSRLWLHAHLLFALLVEQTVGELDPIPP